MTTIASYVAYCQPGAKHQLCSDLACCCCEVLASENEDVVVLVTEQTSGPALDQFEADVASSPHVRLLAMVSGFCHEEEEEQ